MKFYIQRDDQPDFVCMAESATAAIVMLWLGRDRETPRTSYRIHQGRAVEATTISSAEAYWRLAIDLRPLLTDVLEETSTADQYTDFCETVIQISLLNEDHD